MTLSLGIFYLAAAFTIGAAAVVVLGRNIVRAAVALIFSFCGVAALYVLLDAEFLAAVQVLIYVGGITILLLFAIMLTTRISSATARVINDQVVLSAIAAAGLLAGLIYATTRGIA
ncbi:MAG TPA: NADH-quinone oxidoreductase subunit J, partial [Candidatus Methylomirabilis sp.]